MSDTVLNEAVVLQQKKRKRWDGKTRAFVALMLLPASLFLLVFMFFPIEETFRISTMESSGISESRGVGLENYAKLLVDEEFLAGLSHVFAWAFWSVVIQLPLAFFIAFSLTYYKNRFTGPLRAIYYLANVMPSAITAMLGKFLFNPANGIISSFAKAVGWEDLAYVDFLGNGDLAFWAVFAMATWTYTGFPIIYLMARIEQIPQEITEAAQLDGVNGWSYALRIVLPQLGYPMRILAILATVGSLKLFDLPFLMTSGGPGFATVTLGITLYKQGFVNWNYGKAAAIGVVIFLLSLVFTIFQLNIGKSKEST